MIPIIHLEDEKNLVAITDHINSIIKSEKFTNYVKAGITDDIILEHLPRFSITIVSDNCVRSGGDVNEVILCYTKFRSVINSFDDLLEQFIHDTLHEIAWKLWKNCPVSIDVFTPQEMDVFDEMWGQAYLYMVSPDLINLHQKYLNKYITSLGENPDSVDTIIRLFANPKQDIDNLNGLDRVHSWLYSSTGILTQDFFSRFMLICQATLSKDGQTRDNIITYNKIFNGGTYEPN